MVATLATTRTSPSLRLRAGVAQSLPAANGENGASPVAGLRPEPDPELVQPPLETDHAQRKERTPIFMLTRFLSQKTSLLVGLNLETGEHAL